MRRWFLSQETELLRYNLIPRFRSASNLIPRFYSAHTWTTGTKFQYPPLRYRFRNMNSDDINDFFGHYKDDFSFERVIIPQVEFADEKISQV